MTMKHRAKCVLWGLINNGEYVLATELKAELEKRRNEAYDRFFVYDEAIYLLRDKSLLKRYGIDEERRN